MAALLALLTSALYGTGDFFGGLATKRHHAVTVLLTVQTAGLVGLTVTMPLYDAAFGWSDLVVGGVAGLAGLAGLTLLYRSLAAGPMAVVAPLTALTSAIVPVLWDTVGGGRPSALTGIGMLVGLAAIGTVSVESADKHTPVKLSVISESLMAGTAFGLFFAILSETGEESAPWPILGARLVSVALLLAVALGRRVPIRPAHDRRVMIAGGLCDTGANVTFLFALKYGALAPVAVLSSLYPAATVVWARVLLGETLDRRKIIGLATALLAVALIAGG